jgi:hypothetical protein
MLRPLTRLRQIKLQPVFCQTDFLKLRLQLLSLCTEVRILQFDLLIELVHFDLQFDSAFAFKITSFEQLKLKLIVLLP